MPPHKSSENQSSFGFLALGKQETLKPEPAPEPADDGHDVLAEILDTLARVTGKNLAFMRPGKRDEF